LLEHHLVTGNSLVGIGRVGEIEEKARDDKLPLFSISAEKMIGAASGALQQLAQFADATTTEIRRARTAMAKVQKTLEPAKALCDILTACRIKGQILAFHPGEWEKLKRSIVNSSLHRSACATLKTLAPVHFPIAFPEVFLRPRDGFDVILGNPPWEK